MIFYTEMKLFVYKRHYSFIFLNTGTWNNYKSVKIITYTIFQYVTYWYIVGSN
jgi:hypothetical protein